ncbi:MAG: PHA/PHB synthase family protein, partial [Parasphingopyxis sp.]
MAGETNAPGVDIPMPGLQDMQHWTWVLGRAQQLMLAHMAEQMKKAGEEGEDRWSRIAEPPEQFVELSANLAGMAFDPARFAQAQADFWTKSIDLWARFLAPEKREEGADEAPADRRFAAPQWQANPVFDMLRQAYQLLAEHMLSTVDTIEGIEPRQKEQIRFATRNMVDAMAPSNFALTNPEALERAIETKGESLLKGLENMLADLAKGQLTHVDASNFELGLNIAATPGKVIRQTPLYQLIQYAPTTKQVFETPLVIFPPWINRFYILDLNEKKSFVRWAVAQGFTVFMVSWKSADESIADVTQDDYCLAQIDAIDTICELLDVPSASAIGYCVAGTTLAMTLALLTARGEADKVASATFFTAQVD